MHKYYSSPLLPYLDAFLNASGPHGERFYFNMNNEVSVDCSSHDRSDTPLCSFHVDPRASCYFVQEQTS